MTPVIPGKRQDVKFEDALDVAGYGKYSYYIIFLSGVTICCSQLSAMDVGFLIPAAACDLELTSSDKGLLGSAYFFGILLFSHISGFLADTLGRRYVLLRAVGANSLIHFLGSFSPNFWTLVVFKFLSGIATCPCMIATFPFLGEYVPQKQRAKALLIANALSLLSLLYSSCLGWLLLQDNWQLDLYIVTYRPWRLFHLLCGVPSLLCLIMFTLTPESPKFLLTRGEMGASVKVLQRVAAMNSGKLNPEDFSVQSVVMDADEAVPPTRQKGALGALKHIVDQTFPLFKPPFLKNLLLCNFIIFTACLCVNSIFIWLPEVINRIAFYKEAHEGKFCLCEMIKQVEVESLTNMSVEQGNFTEVVCDDTINTAVFLPNLVMSAVLPVILLATSLIVQYIDRRLIILVVMIVCSCMAFAVIWIPDATAIIILFAGIPIFVSISFNVLTSIIVELFPTYIRAMAASINMIIGRCGSILGSYLFSLLIDAHCSLLFNLFAGILLCCAAAPLCIKMKKRSQPESVEKEPKPINGA